jgi:hyperosmotically inducible periplasmic protein
MHAPPRRAVWIAFITPLALAIAIVASGCGPAESEVVTEVKSQLAADPKTSSSDIDVTLADGVLHLSGTTEVIGADTRAVELANTVKGVKSVSADMRLSDTAMAREVKAAISKDERVAKVPLLVTAREGQLYLRSSQTNQEERERIVQIARSVPGVGPVQDEMK